MVERSALDSRSAIQVTPTHGAQVAQFPRAFCDGRSGLGLITEPKTISLANGFVGSGLQFIFAWLILKTDTGAAVFDFAQRAVAKLIGFANEGAKMVFGPLAKGESLAGAFGKEDALVFAVTVTATIILVSAL